MNEKLRELFRKTKGKKIRLFIDSANWFYSWKELDWDIDFEKLLNFLEKYYKVKVLKLYGGTLLDLIQKHRFNSFTKALNKLG